MEFQMDVEKTFKNMKDLFNAQNVEQHLNKRKLYQIIWIFILELISINVSIAINVLNKKDHYRSTKKLMNHVKIKDLYKKVI